MKGYTMPVAKKAAAKKTAAKKQPGKAIATRDSSPVVPEGATLEIYDIPTAADISSAIKGGYKLYYDGVTSEGSLLADQMDRSSTPEELFAESELEKLDDHLGELFTILSIDAVRNSDFEGGLGIYLIVSAADEDGTVIKLSIGAGDPLGKIVKLHEMGALPWAVSFERSARETKAGFHPINVVNRQLKDGSTF